VTSRLRHGFCVYTHIGECSPTHRYCIPTSWEERIMSSALITDLLGVLDELSGGIHPGFRPAHAKGLMCTGTFSPSPEAAGFTRAPQCKQTIHSGDRPLLGLARYPHASRQRPSSFRPTRHRCPLPSRRSCPHGYCCPFDQWLPRPNRRGVLAIPARRGCRRVRQT
jgi:hypothetical protein